MNLLIYWNLQKIMEQKKIRNKDLAEAIQLTENSVYRMRRLKKMPRLNHRTLNSLCVALDCQPADLLIYKPDGDA